MNVVPVTNLPLVNPAFQVQTVEISSTSPHTSIETEISTDYLRQRPLFDFITLYVVEVPAQISNYIGF